MENNINRIAVFSHWDKDNFIDDYVIYYLQGLKKIADNIVFVSDCDINSAELEKLKTITPHTITGVHGEYDFGSYKRGFFYAKENGLLNKAEELILANDSCYGPLRPFEEMFGVMSPKDCDFWGVTENKKGMKKDCDKYIADIVPHIQSYFMVFKKNVFESEKFNTFMNNIKKETEKNDIILNYEIGLSVLLKENFKYKTYIESDSYKNLMTKDAINTIKKKSPLLKTNLLKRKKPQLITFCYKFLLKKYTNYTIDLIEKNKKRTKSISGIENIIKMLEVYKKI